VGKFYFVSKGVEAMRDDVIGLEPSEEEALRYEISDEALEAAAQETAMSYTHQTSAYNRCCR